MESELSGIFRVKLFTKNIVRGSSGTQFTHMGVNANPSTNVGRLRGTAKKCNISSSGTFFNHLFLTMYYGNKGLEFSLASCKKCPKLFVFLFLVQK